MDTPTVAPKQETRFECMACSRICTEAEVIKLPSGQKTCSDAFCGANVKRVSLVIMRDPAEIKQ